MSKFSSGGGGNDFVDTVFDDEALVSITSGSAPFTGSYQPEGSLATLDGIPANGDWTLEVTDDAGSDTGQLVSWDLILTFEAQQCGPVAQLQACQLETDACSTGTAGLGNNRCIHVFKDPRRGYRYAFNHGWIGIGGPRCR